MKNDIASTVGALWRQGKNELGNAMFREHDAYSPNEPGLPDVLTSREAYEVKNETPSQEWEAPETSLAEMTQQDVDLSPGMEQEIEP